MSETEHVNAQSTESQKTFDLTEKFEESIEAYRVEKSQLTDIEILKKVLHGYHAAYFSCANVQLSVKTMQLSSNDLPSALT